MLHHYLIQDFANGVLGNNICHIRVVYQKNKQQNIQVFEHLAYTVSSRVESVPWREGYNTNTK